MKISKISLIQRASLISADLLALLFSLIFAKFLLSVIRPGVDNISLITFGTAKFGGLLLIMVFWYQEQYVKRRPTWEEIRLLYYTIFVFALFHMAFSYFLSHQVIKFLTILFWGLLLVVLPTFRYIMKRILLKLNLWQRGVYIVGTGDNAKATYALLTGSKILGYKILGFIDLSQAGHTLQNHEVVNSNSLSVNNQSLPVFGIGQLYLPENIKKNYEIVLALSSSELLKNSKTINILQSKYTFVSIVPDISGLPLYGVELEHFFGSDQLFLRLQNNLSRRLNRIIKRFFDFSLSLLGIIILSPFLLSIAICIKISAGGAVFFKHKRIGVDGKYFYCIKFKTMHQNSSQILANLLANDSQAKAEWEKDFKLKNDPRVTRIGAFLRKTSLDELPQLFNVIKGDMSLVGPRPIIEEEMLRYGDDAYYYKLVKPGITGLWQISGRNDLDYSSRVRLDVYYTKNWSLWYDFVILFKTVMVVAARSGAY
ncbi:MAG: UDP-phosphate galactose phosphotransferase [Burkholderiales bacterium]|jgi:Undecaprenyl-phosphate galactose phosphotransferase WbaP|nr:UDP-phosphate galactose phosphotransferase [Burkholderiales bacterium]